MRLAQLDPKSFALNVLFKTRRSRSTRNALRLMSLDRTPPTAEFKEVEKSLESIAASNKRKRRWDAWRLITSATT